MANTSRLAIPYPLGAEGVNVDQHIRNVAEAVDAKTIFWRGQGPLSSRPTSSPGTPGKSGGLYYATDNGKLYYDFGTGWVTLNVDVPTLGPDSITATEIAANAVGSSELADGAVDTAAVQDGAITAGKLASALKPSQGAGGGTEALRAIGSGAGQVVAGNDARLTDDRAPASSWRQVISEVALRTNGQTYTITAPATGTYVLGFGAGTFNASGQGAGASISNNKNAVVATYGTVGGSGGPVFTSIPLNAGEVVTLTVSASDSLGYCWATLQRIA